MACKHLRALYDLCKTQRLKLSSSDLIRIMCVECGTEEVCPSVLYEEYERNHPTEEVCDKVRRSGR
jgi:hypothetical protein